MIYLRADGRKAHITKDLPITTGSVGMKVDVSLSEDYDGLASVVTFKAGTVTADVAYVGELVEVPPQVMQRPNTALLIGVYAQSADGRTVIPTVWDSAGIIAPGTLPVDFPQPDPAPSWAAQVQLWAEDAHNTAERLAEEVDGWEAGENERIAAESARNAAETSRARAEATRYSNESTRVTNEASRVLAEQDRQRAESERESAESSRVSAETAREGAEAARASAETARSSAESQRASAEAARKTAESGRASAESSRRTAESGRVSAEQSRVSAEQTRSLAEQARDEAESAREDAESDRETEWATLRASAISATSAASDAAATASATDSAVRQAEQARVAAESSRASAESARQTAEQGRQGTEDARSAAEASRVQAESQRASSESQRASAEQSRASAETARATAEQARATAESNRAAAETSRVTAESNRNQAWSELSQEAQEAIDAATEAAESVSDDVDALYNGNLQLFGNQLTGTLSGTIDTADDAYAAPPIALTVYGVSTQVSYTGKNLFDATTWIDDGRIPSANTGALTPSTVSHRSALMQLNIGTYTYSLVNGYANGPKYVHAYDSNDTWLRTLAAANAEAIGTTFSASFEVASDVAYVCIVSQIADTKVQLELGTTATAYEPYTGGKPSPNPDYPQPILSVDELGLVVAGKNLLDRSTEEAGYINSVGGQSGGSGWLRSTYIPIAGGGTYTFTPNSNAGGSAYGCCYDANKSAIASSLFSSGPTTFTAPENARYVRVSYRDTSTNVQLEAGSTATDYMSYVTPITVPDLLPEGTSLRSLPDGTNDVLHLSYLRPSTSPGWAWYSREVVQKVGMTTTAATDGITGTVGVDVMSTTGEIADGPTVLYKLASAQTTTLDPIELPELPAPNATVWCDGGSSQPSFVMEYVKDTNIVIAEMQAALADLATS